MSLHRYQSTQNATEDARSTEYRLFAAVTRALIESQARGGKGFVEAVDWNRRMWLTFQADLASDENQLPDDVKAGLISLAIWVERHSAAVLRGRATIDPLIDVNKSVMGGLAG